MSLVVDRLTKQFGRVIALDELTFEVPQGSVFGFLGPNGAGKTTTMRIALGVVRPDRGSIRWAGQLAEELPRRTWGYLPEERGLYHRMTVLDQLVYFGRLHGLPADRARREAHSWLTRFRIPDLAERRTEELSKGNQQKVQFVAAILHDPAVLLMDEPFTGLDPVNVSILRDAFLELRDRGKTLVFSTHQMETVESLCESVAIIDRGRLVASGTLREVKRSTGRRGIRVATERPTDGSWLGSVAGVEVVRRGIDELELSLAPETEPDAVLAAALAAGSGIRHFEVVEPSLEQVFIERVGRPLDDAGLDARLDEVGRPLDEMVGPQDDHARGAAPRDAGADGRTSGSKPAVPPEAAS
jgi:ABC-2 type transport system ATP-binding protein